ncbi:MAG: type II toxin-antitoxin system PemK/MazF family toxin [Burkholderiales bacterium]|nr:type II toxin-antitoxin system PemK/MazF family toxin [Burkholderiales bacterium]
MIYKPFDIVVVPFPFTDSANQKRRPALVLSNWEPFGGRIGHSVMAMITSAENTAWPLDVPIEDLANAGLPAPSVVRIKLFTLDHRFFIQKCGKLAPSDKAAVQSALKSLFPR